MVFDLYQTKVNIENCVELCQYMKDLPEVFHFDYSVLLTK